MRTIRVYHAASGQALVLVAILLPFLVALVLTAVEIGGRMLQRAEVEDALRQATRSAVQTFSYGQFARNTQALNASACQGTRVDPAGCKSNAVAELAAALFVTNLQSTAGLSVPPEAMADRVTWYVLPNGGDCRTILTDRPPLERTFTTPTVCAALDAPMRGLVGWGTWTPRLEAADTLDRIDK